MIKSVVRKYVHVWGMLAVGIVLTALLGESEYQQLFTLVLIWSTFTLGWNVLGGYGGQMSAGHALFFGIGAFVPTLMMIWWDVTPALGIWIGVLAAVATALLVGLPTFRLTGIYFTLATMAIPLMAIPIIVRLGLHELSVPFIRENAAWYFQFPSSTGASYLALAVACVALAATVWLKHSQLGLSLQAVRDNESAAEAAGVPTFRVKMKGLALSAALSSLAGTLMATSVLFVVTPNYVFGLVLSVNVLTMTIVGGTGTVWGPVIGAALIIPATDLLTARYGATLPGLNGALLGLVLILTVIFAPDGIMGRVRPIVSRLRRADSGATTAPKPQLEPSFSALPSRPRSESAGEDSGPQPSPTAEVLLRTKDLSRAYGGLRAVDEVSLEVYRGEILGIIGPNGAGKTTLFGLIGGQVPPSSGTVHFDSLETTGLPPHKLCLLGLGRTFQVVRTFSKMSLFDNVRVGALVDQHASDEDVDAATREAIGFVGLGGIAHRPVSTLNTGDLRRMELARALASRPKIILADECLAGLSGHDVQAVVDILRSIRSRGITVVVIEHTMSAMVDLVDRFVVLDHGRVIAEDVPDRIVKNPDVIEAYLGKKWAEGADVTG